MLTTKEEIAHYHSPINYIKSQAYYDNQYLQYMARRVARKAILTTEEKVALYNIFSRTLSPHWALVELRYFVNGRRLHKLLCE